MDKEKEKALLGSILRFVVGLDEPDFKERKAELVADMLTNIIAFAFEDEDDIDKIDALIEGKMAAMITGGEKAS